MLKDIQAKFKAAIMKRARSRQISRYIRNGRKPWSEGYVQYKENFIEKSINNEIILNLFRHSLKLPELYGQFLDERVVEYPWFLSQTDEQIGSLLDAGSALNFHFILDHPYIKRKNITIVTLEPENNCFWQNRVSYLFRDIRELPFKDNLFDEVVSISTIEHIGMDNSLYTTDLSLREKKTRDYLKAVTEMRRVTKPGGKVYISVPFGRYTDFGWYQQFDSEMISNIIEIFSPRKHLETFFCYESDGWCFSDKDHCANFEGFNIHDTKYFNPSSTKDYDSDYAASSRAVVAMKLWK